VSAHTGREMSIHKKTGRAQNFSLKKCANPDNGGLELLVIFKYHIHSFNIHFCGMHKKTLVAYSCDASDFAVLKQAIVKLL